MNGRAAAHSLGLASSISEAIVHAPVLASPRLRAFVVASSLPATRNTTALNTAPKSIHAI